MKLLKLGLISLVALFALATLIGALLPSQVLVSRATNIKADPDSIMIQLQDIHQWKHWVEGMNDSSVHIQSSDKAIIGRSQVSITHIGDTIVVSEWITGSKSKQLSTMQVINQPARQVTIVQWQFEQKVGWLPWEKLGTMMNDKILGPMMEKNLEQLRAYLEAKTGKF